jgi:hypothetical protein
MKGILPLSKSGFFNIIQVGFCPLYMVSAVDFRCEKTQDLNNSILIIILDLI